MKVRKRFALVAALLLACGCGSDSTDFNFSGTWTGPYASDIMGNQTATVVLNQNGTALSGTFSSTSGGQGTIAGTAASDTATFTVTVPVCGDFHCTGRVVAGPEGARAKMDFTFSGTATAGCGGFTENGHGTLTWQ